MLQTWQATKKKKKLIFFELKALQLKKVSHRFSSFRNDFGDGEKKSKIAGLKEGEK